MIKRITVDGLYGIHSYDIELHTGGVTILTGANGLGKTTLLKIINAVHSCDFEFLCELPFRGISLLYSQRDKSTIIVSLSKTFDGAVDSSESEVRKTLNSNTIKISLEKQIADETSLVETFEVTLHDDILSDNRYRYYRSRLFEEDEPCLIRVSEDRNQSRNFRIFMEELRCNYIGEQRILHISGNDFSDEEPEYEIDRIAMAIKDDFGKSQVQFAEKCQTIDATFINRLITSGNRSYSNEEYIDKQSKLKDVIDLLLKYKLISNIKLIEDYPEDKKEVLSLYLDDMEKKLSAFDLFVNQVRLFDKCVSNKGLSNKRMRLNSTDGILILADNDVSVPLNKLSSGEQNLIILYYNLIFKNNSRSILLIDEPENSLHVRWLRKMLDDFKEMAKLLGCQVIIATHSPAFINGNWDITYDLEDKAYQEE